MKTITLRDGRRLAWHEWGDTAGAPVLVCPGAGMAGPLPFGEAAAGRHCLRLVSIDRPGLGGSDGDPGKSFESWSDDVAELVSALGVAHAPAIGFSQGAPFAFALAAAGLSRRLAIVAGQDELAHPRVRRLLPAEVAGFAARAASQPDALEADIAANATADWLWSMIDAMSAPSDRAVYASPDFAPDYRAALDAGFRQGAAGYARDTVLAMAPWPFRLENIACPVDLWYGLDDTSPVHSPDHGRTLSQRLPRATLHAVEGAGSALLWTCADEILGALV